MKFTFILSFLFFFACAHSQKSEVKEEPQLSDAQLRELTSVICKDVPETDMKNNICQMGEAIRYCTLNQENKTEICAAAKEIYCRANPQNCEVIIKTPFTYPNPFLTKEGNNI